MLHGARWNSPGRRVIYASETYAGALLEILVHASGSLPQSLGYIEIEIPTGLSIEEISQDDVPHWDSASSEAARIFGDQWYDERRTPVLIVPSVVTFVERNVLINQEHPESARIRGEPSLASALGCSSLGKAVVERSRKPLRIFNGIPPSRRLPPAR